MADKCEAYRALVEEEAGRGAGPVGTLAAHLDMCDACRRFAREREALVGLLAGLERVSAPEDFEFRLRARMARRGGAEGSWLRRLRLAPGLAVAGLAACLLVAAALYFRAQKGGNDSVAARPEAPASPAPQPATGGQRSRPADGGANLERTAAGLARDEREDKSRRLTAASVTETAAKRNAPRPRRASREENFGVGSAPVIKVEGRELASHTATGAVPLRTSTETLRVVLRDERGGAYVVPLRSVSFGAQGPVGRAARTSHTDKEGVW